MTVTNGTVGATHPRAEYKARGGIREVAEEWGYAEAWRNNLSSPLMGRYRKYIAKIYAKIVMIFPRLIIRNSYIAQDCTPSLTRLSATVYIQLSKVFMRTDKMVGDIYPKGKQKPTYTMFVWATAIS